ncbi:hypothetical protein ACFO1B_23985 [Dactylosporangium siamense]|uniref:Uncharacterized protein n=1 Tax=Dactylosporangium siamense TaxID=685454 RepID=A0A919UCX0_9ACTN|nr:hypothetical protein [Dactylosporangium siamense]GIG47261.1 hypothetical protein Dsi01nite_053020 [Dactylosporangium siamense]
MQLRGIQTADGTTATLRFTGDGVFVVGRSARQHMLLRLAGGSAFAALAVAMTAMGVGGAVSARAGVVLFVLAGVVGAAAVAVACAGWALSVRAGRAVRDGVTPPDLPLSAMRWARSTDEGGRVRVTVGMDDGGEFEFMASGQAGADLVRRFAGLLGAGGPPGGFSAQG